MNYPQYVSIQGGIREARWSAFILPWCLLFLSWSVLAVAFFTRQDAWLDHDYLLASRHLSWQLALLLFILSWQVMVLAMMLPGLCVQLWWLVPVRGQSWPVQLQFILGFSAAWTLFALGAFSGDGLLHNVVRHWQWLYLHSVWIGATLLVVAGVFQWSSWKLRCLERFHIVAVDDGGSPLEHGWRYGLWDMAGNGALMLVMFGIGMRSFLALASLSALMWIEHANCASKLLPRLIGVSCFIAAILWLVL
ncbi:hypothetical protein KDA_72640 [Dictyobacter alpinus]|uniref:Uncharacterized protein n=1 Tax=Dictyobacter alpinus TaxID=2014873 RepID=A0A402BKD0_9CHLR|nr:DUF2182 domain-containing protein [Dictyobacter alpinus]GCE31780.1 hypothetical protein KDA_72640 [Dictyobacter alpinus]